MDSQSAYRLLSPRLQAQACASVAAAPPWSERPGVAAQIAAIIATIPDVPVAAKGKPEAE